MKQYISNGIDIYLLITSQTDQFYICGETIFPKDSVITDYYPLDNMQGRLYVHTVPFYNY